MFRFIKDAYKRRAASNRRAALSAELDSIYTARRYFEKREKEIVQEVKNLDTHEVSRIPTTRARAW